jgi:hypothetical protein
LLKLFLAFLGIDIDKELAQKQFEADKAIIAKVIVQKDNIFEGKKIGDDFMKTTS